MYLGIEEHVLADGKAQAVLRGLKSKSEQPSVVGQHDFFRQLEWQLLLWVQCKLAVATATNPKFALIIHLLHIEQQ